jgi:hypothetical protein
MRALPRVRHRLAMLATTLPRPLHFDLKELGRFTLATPCFERWELMRGDARTRRCSACERQVHNLEALTLAEARALLTDSATGRVCMRFFLRLDGTLLTRDCPRGFRALRLFLKKQRNALDRRDLLAPRSRLQRAMTRAAVATLAALAFVGADELVSWVRLPLAVVSALGTRLPAPTKLDRKRMVGLPANVNAYY